jgi:hypothetical protein
MSTPYRVTLIGNEEQRLAGAAILNTTWCSAIQGAKDETIVGAILDSIRQTLAISAQDVTVQELKALCPHVIPFWETEQLFPLCMEHTPSVYEAIVNDVGTDDTLSHVYPLSDVEIGEVEGDDFVKVRDFYSVRIEFHDSKSDDMFESYDGVVHHYYTKRHLVLVAYNQLVEIPRSRVVSLRTHRATINGEPR